MSYQGSGIRGASSLGVGSSSLAFLLAKTGIVSLPDMVLVGAILETISSYNRSSVEKVAEWAEVGRDFLEKTKGISQL